ncbi:ribosome silencing factor [Marinisporobacter balticus]|uniref:Ribosomal silencing factor RsfS n=1 Tax=Marinisporobacter balticus TaxID=2018667 RepID=A0A4R2L580_9FIRM|nr:ribosome silencing factor [Marinisporobacter balticus]TCO79026.1 ribosome-associated protein [Marinisporobacter balticus]
MTKTSREIALKIAKSIDDKKGQDIQILDIKNISNFADYFVIAHGTSTRQTKAMADEIEEKMKKEDILIGHKEGYVSGSWVLLDYINVVVHLFIEEERNFYNIERVWKDATHVNIDNL